MDIKDGYSYAELRKHYSTRRYIYEGHGALKHDKTLILHKPENTGQDTIVLRLCKRIGGRIAYSPCYRGKFLIGIFLALTVVFCYFNLFSSYLPRTCQMLSLRSNKLKAVPNETVYVRTRNSLFEGNNGLTQPKLHIEQAVSTFTKKIAIESWDKIFTSKLMKHISSTTALGPNSVLMYSSITEELPSTNLQKYTDLKGYLSSDGKTNKKVLFKTEYVELYQNDNSGSIISRIVKTADRGVNLD